MIIALLGLAGGTVGAVYSWATSVYSYNREAWMTDIQILQNHDYQYDNLQIATHNMSREQVRDRTQAAITKLNNYILVTTLIIALAAEMLVEGNIDKDCADFVLNVYMLALGSAVLYLALGALFGVAASNVIYETSAQLLTTKVPPPWSDLDVKMQDREAHKMTQAFERRPLRQIFMPPLFRRPQARSWLDWDPFANTRRRKQECLTGCGKYVQGVTAATLDRSGLQRPPDDGPTMSEPLLPRSWWFRRGGAPAANPEPASPLGNRRPSGLTDIETSVPPDILDGEFPQIPHPTQHLGALRSETQGSGATSRAQMGRFGPRFSDAPNSTSSSGNSEEPPLLRSHCRKTTANLGAWYSPDVDEVSELDDYLTPSISHRSTPRGHHGSGSHHNSGFGSNRSMKKCGTHTSDMLTSASSGSPHAGRHKARGMRMTASGMAPTPIDDEEKLFEIKLRYERGWDDQEALWMPMFDCSQRCVVLGLHSLLQAYGYLCMANLYGDYSSAWAFWLVQSIFLSLNLLITNTMFDKGEDWYGRYTMFIVAAGPSSCAVAATTAFVWLDRILVPVCYISHLLVAMLLYGDITTEEKVWDCITDSSEGLLCELAQSKRDSAEFETEGSLEHSSDDEEADMVEVVSAATRHEEKMRATHEKHADRVRTLVRRMMFWGSRVVRLLWLISVLWSIHKAMSGNGFKNRNAVIPVAPSGPPVAGMEVNWTSWPSPYFRPHALVCPKDKVFLADEFRVWQLDRKKEEVTPYDCDVNGTIADLASQCDDVSCWPMVLLTGVPPMVFDCKHKRAYTLLQSSTSASRFSTRGHDALYVARGERVLKYGWSDTRHGWAPQWDVVTIAGTGLDAMDVVKNRLLLFRSQDSRTPGAGSSVELVNLTSGQFCGVWELPPALVGAGCAEEGGAAVLVLTRAPFEGAEGNGIKLMKATLQADGRAGCPESDSEAAAAAKSTETDSNPLYDLPAEAPAQTTRKPPTNPIDSSSGNLPTAGHAEDAPRQLLWR